MKMRGPLPRTIRVEAKFTTGESVVVPQREREALLDARDGAAGVVAVLFWCGVREVDGEWLVVDAAESLRSRCADSGSLGLRDLRRLHANQPWLDPLRAHVGGAWKRFLAAYGELALAGHEALVRELDRLHRDGALADRLGGGDVLDFEHGQTIRRIVAQHGESVAGHVFQDLFAYLLGLAGYRTVRVNPIGVPDIEVSGLGSEETAAPERIRVELSRTEVEHLIELARAAGDTALAARLGGR